MLDMILRSGRKKQAQTRQKMTVAKSQIFISRPQKLPPELLLYIFKDLMNQDSAICLKLMLICRAWKSLFVHRGSLWSPINVTLDWKHDSRKTRQMIQAHLRHSGSTLLDITVELGDPADYDSFMDDVLPGYNFDSEPDCCSDCLAEYRETHEANRQEIERVEEEYLDEAASMIETEFSKTFEILVGEGSDVAVRWRSFSYIVRYGNLDDSARTYLLDRDPLELPNLQHLELIMGGSSWYSNQIAASSPTMFGECTQLASLITDDAEVFRTISSSTKRLLDQLDIRFSLSWETFSTPTEHLGNLQTLSLSYLPAQTLQNMTLPKLKSLVLGHGGHRLLPSLIAPKLRTLSVQMGKGDKVSSTCSILASIEELFWELQNGVYNLTNPDDSLVGLLSQCSSLTILHTKSQLVGVALHGIEKCRLTGTLPRRLKSIRTTRSEAGSLFRVLTETVVVQNPGIAL